MNQYLTIESKKLLSSANRLKQDLHKRHKYLKLRSLPHRYKINATDMGKLTFSTNKFGIIKKQQEKTTFDTPTDIEVASNQSLQSIDQELNDIKKLLSFLVQQNEQSRLQQNKFKEQNGELIQEINELKQLINEMKQEQDAEYEREYHSFTTIYKSLLHIEEKVNDISNKTEDKKFKTNWQKKLFEK